MDKTLLIFLSILATGTNLNEASTIITFPTSFTSSEHEKIDPLNVKNFFQKGIDAVQSVAGLVQNLLLHETVNYVDENWIISPVSLAGVFAQLLMGSRGDIRQILSELLSLVYEEKNCTKLEVHRQLGHLLNHIQHWGSDDYILLLSNAVFVQDKFLLKTTYKHALWDFYKTPVIPVDFTGKSLGSINKVNEWLRNSTQNRFSDLISLPLSPSTISIMASVVYFKGSWESPFDPDYTQPGLFYVTQNEKVRVNYMYGEQEILYGNATGYQLIGLPYKSRDVVMYILLPNGEFSAKVAIKQFDKMASSAKLENVTLVLPKVKLTTTVSVKDALTKCLKNKTEGVSRYANKKPSQNLTVLNELDTYLTSPAPLKVSSFFKSKHFDMSGASEDVRFKIDDIVHKVSMEIDELGTELVAATSTLVDHSGGNIILKVNRPFLFFVRHEITQTHLFWGFVANPTKTSKFHKNRMPMTCSTGKHN